ncbi:MAG: hypothetical protein PHI31_03410 [Desulfuromonadaceae bacterium]|nr:hypothetical protein [Desulfuromonadaceae bacterium]
MGKMSSSLVFCAVGATGGITALPVITGMCAGGNCTACFNCAGMGVILVAVALWNKKKGDASDELAQRSN